MNLFLAVDAGGTKTDLLLADDTRTLGRVRTGSIKRMRVDAASAAASLDAGLRALSAQTSLTMDFVTRTCIGTAGETVPLVTEWLREAFGERIAGELLIVGDVEIALDAAFPGEAGVLVLAGTGSNVAGRTTSGALVGAGGWGPILADQGSGHRIGVEALRAAFLAIDEGRASNLMRELLACWGLASPEHLVSFANALPAPDFSRLTEAVVRCALGGDSLAAGVLRQQGEELAYLVRLVVRRLIAAEPTVGWVPRIACAGSILEEVGLLREALFATVQKEFPGITSVEGVVDPVLGALWRARKAPAR